MSRLLSSPSTSLEAGIKIERRQKPGPPNLRKGVVRESGRSSLPPEKDHKREAGNWRKEEKRRVYHEIFLLPREEKGLEGIRRKKKSRNDLFFPSAKEKERRRLGRATFSSPRRGD